jgi:hypothetical protein
VWAPFVKGDFDQDGNTDLLFRNAAGDTQKAWLMNGTVRQAEHPVTPDATGAGWQIGGVDDFDGDGQSDLLYWDGATGAVEFWLMNGTDRVGAAVPLTGAPPLPTSWKPVATADFDGDGHPDIVWRSTTSQQIVIWTLDGTSKSGTITPVPGQAVDANWQVVAAQDCNGDGNTDLLWYNVDSGKIVEWLMGADVHRTAGLFTNPPNAGANNWRLAAGGDFGVGPGGVADSGDLVWRNADSGRVVVWHMDFGGNRTAGTFTTPDSPTPNPTAWTIVGPR